jgi:hypothetical protein
MALRRRPIKRPTPPKLSVLQAVAVILGVFVYSSLLAVGAPHRVHHLGEGFRGVPAHPSEAKSHFAEASHRGHGSADPLHNHARNEAVPVSSGSCLLAGAVSQGSALSAEPAEDILLPPPSSSALFAAISPCLPFIDGVSAPRGPPIA